MGSADLSLATLPSLSPSQAHSPPSNLTMEIMQQQMPPSTAIANVSAEQAALSPDEQHARCNLIVNYVPNSLTQDRLHAMFQVYGEVQSCKLMIDKNTGRSMGYGFILFKRMEDAANAIEGLNNQQVDGKTLRVKLARDPADTTENTNLYVAHLEPSMNETAVRQLFGPYGQLVEVKLLVDPKSQQHKGAGFVKFANRTGAQAAQSALNGHTPTGCSTSIVVRFADTPSDKKKRLKQKQQGGMGMDQRYNPMAAQMHAYQQQASMFGAAPMYGFAHTADPTMLMHQRGAAAAAMNPYAQYTASPYASQANAAAMPTTGGQQMASGGANAATGAAGGYTLFVYSLPPEADDTALFRWFGPYGGIMGVQVARDKRNNAPKGYGFVTFTKFEDAQQAIVALNGATIAGKTLQVSFKSDKKLGR